MANKLKLSEIDDLYDLKDWLSDWRKSLNKQIQDLEDRITAAPLKAAATGPWPGGGARSAGQGEADTYLADLHTRYPQLKRHPKSYSTIGKHFNTLGGEPSRSNLEDLRDKMEGGRTYTSAHLSKLWDIGHGKAIAFIYLMAKCELVEWYEETRGYSKFFT